MIRFFSCQQVFGLKFRCLSFVRKKLLKFIFYERLNKHLQFVMLRMLILVASPHIVPKWQHVVIPVWYFLIVEIFASKNWDWFHQILKTYVEKIEKQNQSSHSKVFLENHTLSFINLKHEHQEKSISKSY